MFDRIMNDTLCFSRCAAQINSTTRLNVGEKFVSFAASAGTPVPRHETRRLVKIEETFPFAHISMEVDDLLVKERCRNPYLNHGYERRRWNCYPSTAKVSQTIDHELCK